jgi:hypothetical protein
MPLVSPASLNAPSQHPYRGLVMSENRNLSGCQVFKLTEAPSEWDCVPLKERILLFPSRRQPIRAICSPPLLTWTNRLPGNVLPNVQIGNRKH